MTKKTFFNIFISVSTTAFVCLFILAKGVNAQNVVFVSDLSINSVGEEVLSLQKILNSDTDTRVAESGAGSPGNETNFFGERTRQAVIRFQEKNASEILVPLNLLGGTGIVGSRTRAVLNKIGGFADVNSSENGVEQVDNSFNNNTPLYPRITAVSPGEVSDPRNAPVTIYGENFGPKNTVYLSVQDVEMFEGNSTDGKTITLFLNTVFLDIVKNSIDSVPETADPAVRQKTIDALKNEFNSVGKNGVYVPAVIFVKNDSGESNKFLININVLKDGE